MAKTSNREVEWQFDAVDTRLVEQWLRSYSPPPTVSLGAQQRRELTDIYLDTNDWRIYRAGYSLRIRDSGGSAEATLKSFSEPVDGKRTREEINEPLASADPALLKPDGGVVGEVARALAGAHEVAPIFELRNLRSVYPLELYGEPAGELVLDETAVPIEGEDEPIRLHRVEVEVATAPTADLERLVADMREGCKLRPVSTTKYEAGLFARGLTPTGEPELGPTEIDASLSLREVAYAVLRKHFGAVLRHEAGTRLGEDPEELHDMRVATRRLRAAMRLFQRALPPGAPRLREELRWLASALGEVRDLDVQLGQLQEWLAELPLEERADLESLQGVLERQRAEARRRMLRVLNSKRYERLVSTYTIMVQRGGDPGEDVPVLAVAPDLLNKRLRALRKKADGIKQTSAPEEYHSVRIEGKKLRYALEFLSPVYGKPAQALIAPLVAMQDVLGAHQDATVAVARLRQLSEENRDQLSPLAVFAMGRLAERYDDHAAELRARFPKVSKGIGGKDWKKLQRVMEKQRPPAPEPEAAVEPEAELFPEVASVIGDREASPTDLAPATELAPTSEIATESAVAPVSDIGAQNDVSANDAASPVGDAASLGAPEMNPMLVQSADLALTQEEPLVLAPYGDAEAAPTEEHAEPATAVEHPEEATAEQLDAEFGPAEVVQPPEGQTVQPLVEATADDALAQDMTPTSAEAEEPVTAAQADGEPETTVDHESAPEQERA